MNADKFYVSRFVLIFGPITLVLGTLGTLFLGWVAYILTTRYNASLAFLAALWMAWIVFVGMCLVLWISAIALLRRRTIPVISFETDHVTYQTATGAIVTIPLSEIQGVEVEPILTPKYGGGHILVYRQNSHKDKIFIFNLNASHKEVFLAFKERLPHLLQPYSTIERLIRAA